MFSPELRDIYRKFENLTPNPFKGSRDMRDIARMVVAGASRV
jgi:hypothetical protein